MASNSRPRKSLRELERKSIAVLTAAGYACSPVCGFGFFNVIGIGRSDIVLVQIMANRWPDSAQVEGMRSFPAPRNARKLIHKWRNYARTPDVKEVT